MIYKELNCGWIYGPCEVDGRKECSNEMKYEGDIIVIDYYDWEYNSKTYKGSKDVI